MTPRWTNLIAVAGPILILIAAHVATHRSGEPYFNNDETRHVMTGVFVRDAALDADAWSHPRSYATRYYLHYPALGLLVWPPFFYLVEGAFMLAFGTSFPVAKMIVGLFLILACVSLFRLVTMTHDRIHAAFTVLLFGLTPLVFTFSRHVMLELPTLALALVAIFHFERYLKEERRRDAWLACVAAALAALTRYDAVFLLPFFFLRLLMVRRPGLLLRRHVLAAAALALLLTAPVYWLTWREYGGAIQQAAGEGTRADFAPYSWGKNLPFYPRCVPEQLGWPATAVAAIGLVAACRPGSLRKSAPYFALLIAVYATFTPLAELEPRHAIYWVPALSLMAVSGIVQILKSIRFPKAVPIVLVILAAATAWPTVSEPMIYVRGYDAAARHVVDHTGESPVCLFDGELSGNFIYQIRRRDPYRRLTVLRGDKLIYGTASDSHAAYTEWAKTDAEILQVIDRFDPEWIVIEEPQLIHQIPAAARLREVLSADPKRIHREFVVPLDNNHYQFAGARLVLYRNTKRNPNREPLREMEMLNLRRRVTAE